MGKFNCYARRTADAAEKMFNELQTARATLTVAQAAKNNAPRAVDPQTAAKAARLEAEFQEARANYDVARRTLPDRAERELSAIRRELEDAVNAAFVADPKQVDTATMELLRSGILTAADYEKLMADAAGNATMTRLIAAAAGKAAEALQDKNGRIGDRAEWSRLTAVSRHGTAYTAASVLSGYDVLRDVVRRCIRNPSMIPRWEELTGGLIENF